LGRPSSPTLVLAAAALAALPAVGCAQFANLTLYGRLNLDVEVVNGRQANESDPSIVRVSSNSSRLGISGTEYLGQGITAIFQLESGIPADTGGGTLASRETFVGFDAPWGTVKVGNFLAPYDDIHPIFGNVPTLTSSILSTASLWAQGFASKSTGGFDARLPNSIRYDSPDINGLTGSVQVSVGEGTAYPGNVQAYVLSTGALYLNGPLQLGLAYERNQNVRLNPIANGEGLVDQAASAAGAWNFGDFRLGGIVEYLRYSTPLETGATASLYRWFWGLSGTLALGPGTAYAFYGSAGDGKGTSIAGTRVAGLARGDDTGSAQWELSYTYPLSRRTLLYAGYVQIANQANASYTFNINPYPIAIGGRPSGFVLGTVHFF
jgi:predicted porin